MWLLPIFFLYYPTNRIGEYSKLSNGVCNLDLTLNSHRKCKEYSMENMHTDEGRRGLISVSKESVSNTSNCLYFCFSPAVVRNNNWSHCRFFCQHSDVWNGEGKIFVRNSHLVTSRLENRTRTSTFCSKWWAFSTQWFFPTVTLQLCDYLLLEVLVTLVMINNLVRLFSICVHWKCFFPQPILCRAEENGSRKEKKNIRPFYSIQSWNENLHLQVLFNS